MNTDDVSVKGRTENAVICYAVVVVTCMSSTERGWDKLVLVQTLLAF